MATRFQGKYDGIGDMLSSPWMVVEMRRRAQNVKSAAESTAPVWEEGPHPGLYRRSFRVVSGVREKTTKRTRRAYGQVVNDSAYAFWVEYGSRRVRRHRTLGRALDAAGG